MTPDARNLWHALDVSAPSCVVWARLVGKQRLCVLLGAFDPPTNAHVAMVDAASRRYDVPGALVLTKVALARPTDDALLTPEQRIELLVRIADRMGLGLAFANRGTYLEVGRALKEDGFDPVFVIGADKLEQLADPSFYDDGSRGVEATFTELRFLVVPRAGLELPAGVEVLHDAFVDDGIGAISATAVRRSFRSGDRVDHLVPPEVAQALQGYTSAR